MDLSSFLWLIIGLYILSLSIYLIIIYKYDHEIRKIIYALGLIFSLSSFIVLAFFSPIEQNTSLVTYNLFRWGSIAYLILIFHVTFEQLFSKRVKGNLLLYSFLFFNILSFILIITNNVSYPFYVTFMVVGTFLIIINSFLIFLKFRNLINLFYLLSIFSSIVASMNMRFFMIQDNISTTYFSIYAYLISYLFIGFIVISFYINDKDYSDGFGSYFALKKELEYSEQKRNEYLSRYKALFNTHSDFIYIYDFYGNFLDANEAALKTTGYSREEMKNMNFIDIIEKGQIKKAFQLMKEIKKNGYQKKPEEFKITLKDGSKIDVDVIGSMIFENNRPIAMQGIARNITERKKNEEELTKLANVIEYSSELVNLATLDGNMIFLNPAGGKMLGIDPNEVDQYNIMQVIPDHLVETVQQKLLPTLLKGGVWKGDLQYKNIQDDSLVDVHAMTFVVKDKKTSEPLYLANVSLDITDRKNAENELKDAHTALIELNTDLEKKVEERTIQIKELLKQKDEFINQLGHDLKNPIGPLIQLLPILEHQETDPRKREMISVMKRNVGYMKNLVTKTIELAKLNSPETKFYFQEKDFIEIIQNVIDTNTFFLQDKHIKINNEISESIRVDVDQLRIEELLTNLLNNAIKYSNEYSTIHISAKNEPDFVTISIRDSGIGMDEEQINHMFDEFYKADSSRHNFESSGLGMTICKRIVEKHGGRIWVESQGLNKGTIINFTLQKHQSSSNKSDGYTIKNLYIQNSRIQWIPHKGKKILYLDYTNLKSSEYEIIYEDIKDFISNAGSTDLLVLTNIEGTYFNMEAVKKTKSLGELLKPYLKKNAIVGLTTQQLIFLKAIKTYSGIQLKHFTSMDLAKDWLVKE